jgi:formylmethanofuran dehydrogenase subunit E
MPLPDFETLLQGSAQTHGHLCAGQVIGVRMAMLGLKLIGLENPRATREIKKLMVYVEIDRCATDAIAHVTGARLGRRSLKFMDYGIMAATFYNLETNQAYRVLSTEEARDLCPVYAPEISGKAAQQLEAYKRMPDSVLFKVQAVHVRLAECDAPGPTRHKITCTRCGQVVRDRREAYRDGRPFCRPCTDESYFADAREILWSRMNGSLNLKENPELPNNTMPRLARKSK